MPLRDLTGQRFGRLLVIGRTTDQVLSSGRTLVAWACICDCGQPKKVSGGALVTGRSKSCGCFRREHSAALHLKHGEARRKRLTPEFKTWVGIIKRCTYKKYKDWPLYGGRGITICDRWRCNFQAFLEDMGRKPSPRHSIDRFPDVDGNYEPSNCRWATPSEQAKNQRRHRAA